ncbi:MAG TPA: multidrug effflux MFS transporter [Arthrobacter sp.]|nr:multidrug effflux MFS transporter [Arthrobacter sp.]
MTTITHPGDALTRRQRLVYIVILGALTALGPFTIDLYLPALPAIEEDLRVSEAAVQLTLAGTTVGFGLGQLMVGPFSDKVGRRTPLIMATTVHVLASIGAALSTDITVLMIFRVLQGIGAAGGGVVAMATVRDLFGGYPLVRMLSRMALVNGLAPIFAPVIGSQLLLVLDWPGIFWFLAVYAVLVLAAAALFIVETLPRERRRASTTTTRERYKAVLSDRIFIGMLLMGGLNFAGLFTYLSASPFLFQDLYGLSAQGYGLLFGINSIGVVFGVQASARIMRRVGPQWVMACSTASMFTMGWLIAIFDWAGFGFWGTAVPLWLYIMSFGFTIPCIQALALGRHGSQPGTAASLLGAATFGFAGAMAPVVGLFSGAAAPMGLLMSACIGVAIIVLWTVVRPRTVPPL